MEAPQNLLVVTGITLVSALVSTVLFLVYRGVLLFIEYFIRNPRLPGEQKEL